jgi:hypothetical protein
VAARVAAAGSNRAKLRNGIAVFKNIRVAAPSEGPYKLTVASVSRKVAVQEAVVGVMVRRRRRPPGGSPGRKRPDGTTHHCCGKML